MYVHCSSHLRVSTHDEGQFSLRGKLDFSSEYRIYFYHFVLYAVVVEERPGLAAKWTCLILIESERRQRGCLRCCRRACLHCYKGCPRGKKQPSSYSRTQEVSKELRHVSLCYATCTCKPTTIRLSDQNGALVPGVGFGDSVRSSPLFLATPTEQRKDTCGAKCHTKLFEQPSCAVRGMANYFCLCWPDPHLVPFVSLPLSRR